MSESWKQWERQIVNSRFLLQRYLGGSEHSAVFLTERGIPPQKIAIKFIQVDEPDAQLQLSRWQHAAKLSHPHLLRNFESGRCRLGEFDLLFLLMEYAEENLAQFLSQRPLTPAEARDVLTPALQALAFLHGEGFVHGHVRPSNILAIEDQLKLSSDGISSIAEPSYSPAADTPQGSAATAASAPASAHVGTAAAPALMPAAPSQAPATTSSASAKSEPARPIPPPAARPSVHTQTVAARGTATRPRYDLVQPHLQRPPLLPPLPKINYLPLGILAVLALVAIFLGPRLLHRRAPVQQAASEEPQQRPA